MGENRMIHFEITGRDGAALQRFYGDLFGWKLNTDNPDGYGMTSEDQTGIVVGIGNARGDAGNVTGYITVDSVDAALARAAELGGTVVMPKFSPGPGATLGLFADPEGHLIGVTEV